LIPSRLDSSVNFVAPLSTAQSMQPACSHQALFAIFQSCLPLKASPNFGKWRILFMELTLVESTLILAKEGKTSRVFLEKEKTLKSSKTPKIINFEIQEYK
jgi:hypothetical protein